LELQTTDEFYYALSSAGRRFDRSLMVKLAMTLKTQMLLEGFLAEIVLLPQNKEAMARASAAYTPAVCPEGLEIIFTWRVPRGGRNDRSSTSANGEYLEVRIGDLYSELHEPGLAEDFMKQFFAPRNPVSPAAKKGFITFFPRLLQGPRFVPTTISAQESYPYNSAGSDTKARFSGFFGLSVSLVIPEFKF
jgi:hypothetical protein